MSAAAERGWIGRSLERREDARLLTGRGEYLADVRAPDCLHLCFVRSDHAHAKIRDIRLDAALAMPGAVGAITGAELSQEIQSQKIPVLIPAFAANYRQYWPLAVDEVYWHGEPLAAIVAEDKYVAEDAAAAVEVDYEPLPVITDAEAALCEDSPRVYDDWDSNEIFGTSYTGGFDPDEIAKNDAEVEALFAQADTVLRQRFRTQRCGVCPIETRGALAIWSETDGLTVHLTTQRPHIERLALADLLELSTAEVRVVAPRDQGGGFGVKAPFYREHVVVCHLARKLGRPVRWIETREEHLMTVSQERDQIHDLEIAADKEGRILALRNRGIGDVGDGRQGVYWGFVMPSLGSVMLPNAYAIDRADIKLRCAVTNKACMSPSRSFGALPTRFALERGLDMLARRLGMETAALKRRNLVTEFPFTSVTGVHHDSGDYVRAWDTLVDKVDLAGFRAEQEEARAEGRYIGIGFACGAEFSGIPSDVLVPLENQPGYGVVTMRIDPRGKVAIHEGDAPQGQSHETTMAQVAADAFGIHPDDVSVRHGDTGTTPLSSGTIGARGASYTVAAIAEAAAALKAKMARYMIHDHGLDGASADDFSLRDGAVVYEKDGNIHREFAALADRIVMGSINLPAGESPGLEHTAYFEAPKPMICFTAQAAKVEVDIETGQFTILDYATCEDVGTVINPIVVEGQVQGGVVQGMSNAMFEEFLYDENGQQLTADFENYRLASAADVPTVTVGHSPTPCPDHPLGVRAVGEGRPGPVPGALANAICDALAPFGVEITALPLKPEMILALIEAGRAGNGGWLRRQPGQPASGEFMSLRIAIDTGGTFTDVIAIDENTGEQLAIKTPSTPDDPSRGLINGIQEVVGERDAGLSQILHGTTTATNAVLEHRFEGLGLLVTAGFRHIIEIARQSVPDGYGNSFFWVKPPRLVPLHLVQEVAERMSYDGSIMTPLDERSVIEAVDHLVDFGVTRIAVCLLHSYANSAHEQRVGAIIAESFPDTFVSLSSVVLPEYREYERAMTTLIDVMVKPYCQTYLGRARDRIAEESGDKPFLIMQSNGGIVSSEAAGEKPVTMLLSGPAGGVLGATHMASLAGYNDILTLDVGGTSTDVSLVRGLTPQLSTHTTIEHYPVKTPMLDVVAVGAGGGSLAWIDPYGALKVGPQSAGADPGPICYRRGGTGPTVTDAGVVLGRLPGALIGGGLKLDVDAAREAFEALGKTLGLSAEEAAAGVLEIAASNQVQGIRKVTTTRGLDPGDYAMIAFGGAGGLFAADVADFLGIKTAVSPPNPGNLSAFGLHVCDIKRDYVRTLVRQQSSATVDELDGLWAELEQLGRDEIAAEGVAREAIVLERSADVRYVGEGHEVLVAIPPGLAGAAAVDHMWTDFHRVHDDTFGFHYEGTQDVEVVSLRVRAIGRMHRPSVRAIEPESDDAGPAGARDVYWRGRGWVSCPIWRRESLSRGFATRGPGIVEEYGSTLVVPEGWTLRNDDYGNLILEKEA